MTDPDLAQAFLTAPDERADLVDAVLRRVRAADRRRRVVIAAAGIAGLGLAAAALAATGLLGHATLADLAHVALQPWMLATLGVALTALVAARETLAEL